MDFTVLVPTIREDLDGFKEAMSAIESSFTLPTDFRIVHGDGGKVATLNRSYDDVLMPSKSQVYVTLDDDFVPAKGWQDAVVKMLELKPKVGVVCPWPGDTPEMQGYVGARSVGPWKESDGLRYRMCGPWRHIPGCLLAFRRETALEIGKLPDSEREYDVYEDCWRGRMAYKLGWRSAYVEAGEINLVRYIVSKEYMSVKADAIEDVRGKTQEILAQYGIADPLSWRLRQFAARVLGRAKQEDNIYRKHLDKQ